MFGERIKNFLGGNKTLTVYITTESNYSPSADSIIRDCHGFVESVSPTQKGVITKGVVPSSGIKLFKKTTKKYPIFLDSAVQC